MRQLLRQLFRTSPKTSSDDVAQASDSHGGQVGRTSSPAKASRDTDLRDFVDYFLKPIAADGRLDDHIERKILLLAFHVYGIAEMLSSAAVRTTLDEAIIDSKRLGNQLSNEDAFHTNVVDAALKRFQTKIASQKSEANDFQPEVILTWWFHSLRRHLDLELVDQSASFDLNQNEFDMWLEQSKWPDEEVDTDLEGDEGPSPGKIDSNEKKQVDGPGEVRAKDDGSNVAVTTAARNKSASQPKIVHGVLDAGILEQIETDVTAARQSSGWLHERAAEIVEAVETRLAKSLPGMLFDECRGGDAQRQAVVVQQVDEKDLWFIGDVHGDLLALEAALHYIRQCSDDPHFVFLGDLFDDGAMSYQAVLRVFDLICNEPHRVCLIAGNHDEALVYDANNDRFASIVEPCEFSQWLNDGASEFPPARQLGRAVVRLFEIAPRALFLNDGLLVAHGGVPLKDLWDQFDSVDSLNSPLSLQDFVWTRPSQTKYKRPNRSSRGAQFGVQDFDGFCLRASEVLPFPVRRMIRGHDHVDGRERYAIQEKYIKHPMLTINNLGHRLDRELFGPYERVPCVARYVRDELPEVHLLDIPGDLIRRVYPPREQNDA